MTRPLTSCAHVPRTKWRAFHPSNLPRPSWQGTSLAAHMLGRCPMACALPTFPSASVGIVRIRGVSSLVSTVPSSLLPTPKNKKGIATHACAPRQVFDETRERCCRFTPRWTREVNGPLPLLPTRSLPLPSPSLPTVGEAERGCEEQTEGEERGRIGFSFTGQPRDESGSNRRPLDLQSNALPTELSSPFEPSRRSSGASVSSSRSIQMNVMRGD